MSWDLIGHEWAINLLKEHITRDQLRHAYLIVGPQGVGRRTLALRLAQALNCTQPPEPGIPCQNCPSCRQIGRMQHPDLSIVQSELSAYQSELRQNPTGERLPRASESRRKRGSKSDQNIELSNQILIDQIRDLQRVLALSPYQSQYRIALILQAEDARESAANSLLKTLEEPTSSTILVLTAESAERLPATVVSRCEVLRLRPVSIDQLDQALQSRQQLPADRARLLAHLANGRPGVALDLIQDTTVLASRNAWLDDHAKLIGAGRVERFDYASALVDFSKNSRIPRELQRYQIKQQLTTWMSLWRDVFLYASGASVPLTNIDRQEEIARLSSLLGQQAAIGAIQAIARTIDLIERNINPRLAADVLMLDLPRTS
jgi:DNA polymerase-3 subunit delta'